MVAEQSRSIDFFGFEHSIAWPVNRDNDGVMDHAVDDGGCNDGVAEIVAQLTEIDIAGNQSGGLAITAVNDLEEKGSVSCGFLLQAIEAKLVNLCGDQHKLTNWVTEALKKMKQAFSSIS